MALTVRTAQDLCIAALEDLERVNIGDSVESGELHMTFRRLQDLIAELGITVAPNVVVESFPMVVGTYSYTIGEGGTPALNTVAPEEVVQAYVRQSGSDLPVQVIGEQAYQGITDKSTSNGVPRQLWVKYTAPNVTFLLYPIPDSTDSLFFVSRKPLNEPAALENDVLLTTAIPRKLFNCLKLNLMVDLAGDNATALLVTRAARALNEVKSLNMARTVEAAALEFGKQSGGTILTM